MTPPAEYVPPPLPEIPSNDRLLAIACHLSAFLGMAFVLPLIIYLVKTDSPFVRANAREALNFHITLIPLMIVAFVLVFVFIGCLILPVLVVATVVLPILASIRASEGLVYHYPFCLRLIQ